MCCTLLHPWGGLDGLCRGDEHPAAKARAGVGTAAVFCWILGVGWPDRAVGLRLSPHQKAGGPGEAWRAACNGSSGYAGVTEITLLCLFPGCPRTSAMAATTHQPQAAPWGLARPRHPPFAIRWWPPADSHPKVGRAKETPCPHPATAAGGSGCSHLPALHPSSHPSSPLSFSHHINLQSSLGYNPNHSSFSPFSSQALPPRQNAEPCPTRTWHRPSRPVSPGFASPLLHPTPPAPTLVADVPQGTAEKPGRRLCRSMMALLGLSQRG